MLTNTELITGMRVLVRHFPDAQKFDADVWADYHAVLSHFTLELLAAALLDVMQTYVYPTAPKPAVIYQAGVRALMAQGHSEGWANSILSGDVDRLLELSRTEPLQLGKGKGR